MDGPLFQAVLEPNTPLSGRRITFVAIGLATISFGAGTVFVILGAWPVVPFLGLDIALLIWALRANARAAKRSERITITTENFFLERFSSNGKRERAELPAYFLRVEHDDPGRLGAELAVVDGRNTARKRLVVGSFLSPDDKATLADALREALHRLRNPLFS